MYLDGSFDEAYKLKTWAMPRNLLMLESLSELENFYVGEQNIALAKYEQSKALKDAIRAFYKIQRAVIFVI